MEEDLHQWIQVQEKDKDQWKEKLPHVLDGFPIDYKFIAEVQEIRQ